MIVTNLVHDLTEMRSGLLRRLARARAGIRRTTPGPALVRGGVFLAGLIALAVALPAGFVLSRGLVIVVALPLFPALLPRGAMPTLVILVTAVGWLVSTTYYAEPLTYARLVVTAGALYLVHTLAALAAVLPYDAVVSAGVLGGWLLRAGLVLALTAGLALFVAAVPARLAGGYLLASLAGLALLLGLAGYLAFLVRRH